MTNLIGTLVGLTAATAIIKYGLEPQLKGLKSYGGRFKMTGVGKPPKPLKPEW